MRQLEKPKKPFLVRWVNRIFWSSFGITVIMIADDFVVPILGVLDDPAIPLALLSTLVSGIVKYVQSKANGE